MMGTKQGDSPVRLGKIIWKAALIFCSVVVVLWVGLFFFKREASVHGAKQSSLSDRWLDLKNTAQVRPCSGPTAFSTQGEHSTNKWLTLQEYRKTIAVEKRTRGLCWRVEVQLSDTLRQEHRLGRHLVLAIGDIRSAWTLSSQGQLIAQRGNLKSGALGYWKSHTIHPLSEPQLLTGRFILELFTHESVLLHQQEAFHFPLRGVWWLGEKVLLRAKISSELWPQLWVFTLIRAILAVILLSLAVFYLYLFFQRTSFRPYLAYSLSIGCVGLWSFLDPLAFWGGIPYDTGLGLAYLSYLAVAGALIFFWFLFEEESVPFWLAWSCFGLVGAASIALLFPVWWASIVPMTVAMFPVMGGTVLLLGVVVRGVWKGHPDAGTLLGAILSVVVLIAIRSALDTGMLSRESYPWLEFSSEASALIVAFAMAIALANQFVRTYQALDHSHGELIQAHEAATRFVPFGFLRQIGFQRIQELKLGDVVEREMTVLFSDIRGFTSLSEKLSPQEIFDFVNRYLAVMEPIITQHGGFTDKFIGDAIMAIFPDHQGDSGANGAVQAAIAMGQTLASFNASEQKRGLASMQIGTEMGIEMGIGLHTGSLVLGTVGSPARMDGTVIGDTVNLASRVEGLCKRYGARAVATKQTVAKLSNPELLALREVEQVQVKGKQEAVTLVQLLDAEDPPTKNQRLAAQPDFHHMLEAWNVGDLERADQYLQQALAVAPEDVTLALYRQHIHVSRKNPVIPWNPVQKLDAK